MVIAGTHINDEVIIAAAMALIGLLTALNISIRAKAKKIEADAETVKSDSQVKVKAAEGQLAEQLSLASTLKQFGDILQQQITINDQLKQRADADEVTREKKLAEKEKQADNNYHTLSQAQDRHAAELHSHFRSRFDVIETKIDALPGKLQEDNKQFVQTLVGELITQIADRFSEMTLAQEWYPFPDVSDPEWSEEYIKPLVNRVRLYRRPVSSDSSLTEVEIPATGTTMEIIRGRKKGWIVVRRTNGAKAEYGWLPDYQVLVGMQAVRRATGEMAAVAVPAASLNPT